MLSKPKNHKVRNPWPLILLIAVAALSFLLAAQGLQTMAGLMTSPQ